MAYTKITLTLPEKLLKETDKTAQSLYSGRANFIRNAIVYYINHCKKLEREEFTGKQLEKRLQTLAGDVSIRKEFREILTDLVAKRYAEEKGTPSKRNNYSEALDKLVAICEKNKYE